MHPVPPVRRPVMVPVVILGAFAVVVGSWLYRNRERMVPVAPRVLLSLGGGLPPNLLYETHGHGLGGIVVVGDVAALEVIDQRYVIGTTDSGEMFLLTVRPLKRDESYHDLVERFAPADTQAWRDRCRAVGIESPTLRDPAEVARRRRP